MKGHTIDDSRPSESICDSEHPSLLAISDSGVLGQTSRLSLTVSESMSRWFAAHPKPSTGAPGFVAGQESKASFMPSLSESS